jgi:hypothetical protein
MNLHKYQDWVAKQEIKDKYKYFFQVLLTWGMIFISRISEAKHLR